mmetsp:Transcript_143002/g.356365  ORF Transcript_143002/g.356365 Transcript_143002/m.356365 type:complete len:248 (-) Transcript_143002:211-954(-)
MRSKCLVCLCFVGSERRAGLVLECCQGQAMRFHRACKRRVQLINCQIGGKQRFCSLGLVILERVPDQNLLGSSGTLLGLEVFQSLCLSLEALRHLNLLGIKGRLLSLKPLPNFSFVCIQSLGCLIQIFRHGIGLALQCFLDARRFCGCRSLQRIHSSFCCFDFFRGGCLVCCKLLQCAYVFLQSTLHLLASFYRFRRLGFQTSHLRSLLLHCFFQSCCLLIHRLLEGFNLLLQWPNGLGNELMYVIH